jgi:hypothetical protein
MVENLAESPGICSDGPGSAPNEIPKGKLFSLSGSQKGEKEEERVGFGNEKGGSQLYSFATWVPPARGRRGRSATHLQTVREARGRSGPQARTVR